VLISPRSPAFYLLFIIRLSNTENSIDLDVIYAAQINFLLPLVPEEIGNWNIRRFFCDFFSEESALKIPYKLMGRVT